MSVHPVIRHVWIPGILLLGLWIWLLEPSTEVPPSEELSRQEAGRLSAPAIDALRSGLPPVLTTASDGAGPKIQLRSGTLYAADASTPTPVHVRPSARGLPWMILFDAPIQPEWKAALEAHGAVLRSYLPTDALLLEAPADGLAKLAALPHVAWAGEYRPAYKVQPLLASLSKEEPDLPIPISIQTFAPEDTEVLMRQLHASGASDIRATPARRWGILRAVLPARKAAELALLPEVQWVEHHELPTVLNDLAMAADRMNVETVRVDHGLDGSGQIVAIADTGLDSGDTQTLHPDFAGRILQVFDIGRLTNWSDTYYHGTHVAGSLLGSGAASGGQYRGSAPAAELVFQSFMTADSTLALPDDLNELYAPPYGLQARIHSDSWGSAVEGEYTLDAMTTDEFIWDQPDMLITYSAGNAGTDENRDGVVDASSLDSPASAKNVLAIGASESGRPSGSGGLTARTYASAWPSDFRAAPIAGDLVSTSPTGAPQGIVAFSSRGPAMDGRIKPDIVAPGSDIISPRSRASTDTGWGLLSANTNYCYLGGTSMAAPLAAGAATLVRQYCVESLGMPSPSAALLKATLMGGARSLTPGQYGTNEFREVPERSRPNSVEGWGQVDVGGSLFPTNETQAVLIDAEDALTTGGSHTMVFAVRSQAPLTVVMAYSDYPSALAASVNLVNDLDLKLIDPDGGPHWPNGLSGADPLNNVEGIDVAYAATGRWTLVVSAPNVPQGPQPVALYLRGAIQMPITIEHTPLDNSWTTNLDFGVSAEVSSSGEFDTNSVNLIWIATGSTGGFTTTPMTTTNGSHFEAILPPRPLGSTYWYYLSAGPPEFPSVHPATAPIDLHSFDILPPLTLTVSGSPSNFFLPDPAYGTNQLTSNQTLRASAEWPVEGSNGWRTACVGWQGSGSVAVTGELDFVDFTLTEDSTLTWQWQAQAALMMTSAPFGAFEQQTWHATGTVADSLIAPEIHHFNQVHLSFAGWTVDGSRWPSNLAPSDLQITHIPMAAPRVAVATYLQTTLDTDENHLPDWFEYRHYGELGQDRYGDEDLDSYENELEAADHTDPLDPLSVPGAPVIQHTPLSSPVTSPAPWAVDAVVTDNYEVASATLHWQRNGGLARSVAMTPFEDSTTQFQSEIPSPARNGDVLTYSIRAVDGAGITTDSATWTVTVAYAEIVLDPESIEVSALANTLTNATLYIENTGDLPLSVTIELAPIGWADDVESGTNGWTRTDGNTAWHISTQESVSPGHAWYCGEEPTRLYLNSTHAALVTPAIQIGAVSPRLDFMHWAGFEIDMDDFPDGFHYWDAGVLEISDNDGLTWEALVPEGGYPGLITSNDFSPFDPDTPCFVDTVGWESVGVDLAAYANQSIQLRFRFGADLYTVAEGWRLDDLVVSPHTDVEGWLTLPVSNLTVDAGSTSNVLLGLDTTLLEAMASGHMAILIHHNDPERDSPLILPVALHNNSRSVTVTSSGPGTADPAGQTLVAPATPFSLDLTADAGMFIADIQTNGVIAPLPAVITTQTLNWSSLETNLTVQAVFAPLLPSNAVPTNWLAQHALTTRNWMAEASLDPDGDALLTWQEYELGSNPTNAADARLVVSFIPSPPPHTEWHLIWHAFTNESASYQILSTSNLTDGFTLFTNISAAPPIMTSPPLSPDDRFFGIFKP
jgi:Subtilase family